MFTALALMLLVCALGALKGSQAVCNDESAKKEPLISSGYNPIWSALGWAQAGLPPTELQAHITASKGS